MMKLFFAALAALLLPFFCSPAQAATYCYFSGSGHLTDGQTINQNIRIVVASVGRVHIPGKPDKRPWCYQDWSSGGVASRRIVESPKLGKAKADGFRLWYRGDRVGHDRFSVEHRWLEGSSNDRWYTGRVVYEVDVVDQPF